MGRNLHFSEINRQVILLHGKLSLLVIEKLITCSMKMIKPGIQNLYFRGESKLFRTQIPDIALADEEMYDSFLCLSMARFPTHRVHKWSGG